MVGGVFDSHILLALISHISSPTPMKNPIVSETQTLPRGWLISLTSSTGTMISLERFVGPFEVKEYQISIRND